MKNRNFKRSEIYVDGAGSCTDTFHGRVHRFFLGLEEVFASKKPLPNSAHPATPAIVLATNFTCHLVICLRPSFIPSHFYDHDEVLIARLSNIIASAVETGNSVLIMATQEHHSRLVKALEERLRNLRGLKTEGRLNLLDAEETLSLFMVDGSTGELVKTARLVAWNAYRGPDGIR